LSDSSETGSQRSKAAIGITEPRRFGRRSDCGEGQPYLTSCTRSSLSPFTDIVGSTRLAAERGDSRWLALLAHHNRIVRRQLDRFGGTEVKVVGDGFLATFDGPARAVRCAVAIRDEVKELGLEIRAGLHVGEVEVLPDDIAGLAVHIGARVSALAGASEILVSSTIKDLVVGSDLVFDDQGSHELKGVPGTWRLFALRS